jgi:hypothetical protein
MHPAPVSSATLRLLSCVESFSHDEEGAIGHDDWPLLARVLDRELAVLTRLAKEREGVAAGGDGAESEPDPELLARAEALHTRYEALAGRLNEAKARASEELSELGARRRQLHAVRGAYGPESRRAA